MRWFYALQNFPLMFWMTLYLLSLSSLYEINFTGTKQISSLYLNIIRIVCSLRSLDWVGGTLFISESNTYRVHESGRMISEWWFKISFFWYFSGIGNATSADYWWHRICFVGSRRWHKVSKRSSAGDFR